MKHVKDALAKGNASALFHHIPKTAGMSVYTSMASYFSGKGHIDYDGSFMHEDKRYSASEEAYHVDRPHAFFGNGGNLISTYGHEGSYACFWDNVENPVCFTFLRDPISKIISQFHYVQSHHNQIAQDRSINTVFEDDRFWENWDNSENGHIDYRNLYPWVSNSYVRALSKNGIFKFVDGRPNIDMFKTARSNLEDGMIEIGDMRGGVKRIPLIVCLTERMPESIELLNKAFNWGLEHNSVNHNPSKTITSLSSTARNNLAVHNQWDMELYDIASRRFKEQQELL